MIFKTSNTFEKKQAEVYFNKLVSSGKTIELSEKKKGRTLNQNALFHVWVQVIADHTGYTSLENCKRDIKRALLGTKEEASRFTGEVQQVDYKTSEMSKEELSSFMDKMKIWAQTELGCYLPYYGDPGYEEMTNKYHG